MSETRSLWSAVFPYLERSEVTELKPSLPYRVREILQERAMGVAHPKPR
jgi:hypothetical protein